MTPALAPDVFLAPGAVVIGEVTIGAESSVWFNTVIRGDVNRITIGRRTNLQDLTVVHVETGTYPTVIGDEVTIGHRVIVHGCTIGDRALIGMGSILMNGAVIGEEAVIGAGSLVTEGLVIPPRTLALGAPAKVRRPLTPEEIARLKVSAEHYVQNQRCYPRDPRPGA